MGLLEQVISRTQPLKGEGRWLKGEDHTSLVVDTVKQIFYWNSKEIIGDVYLWLTKVEGRSYEEAKEILKQYDEYKGSFIHHINNKKELVVYPKLIDLFYEDGLTQEVAQNYWKKRGISDLTIDRYKLGYYNEYVTIPIFVDGLFRNFQLRKDIPAKKIRYYYSTDDGAEGRLLFNSEILKVTDKIIITEGPTDCLRLMQEGIPCISHTAGAGGWNDSWFKYLIYQKNIIVVYDNDDAGRLGAIRVAKNLGVYRTKVFNFPGNDKGYDIVDFFNDGNTRDDFLNLVNKEAHYAF